jgi:hypothetical protein
VFLRVEPPFRGDVDFPAPLPITNALELPSTSPPPMPTAFFFLSLTTNKNYLRISKSCNLEDDLIATIEFSLSFLAMNLGFPF